jgi:hypothetical protein
MVMMEMRRRLLQACFKDILSVSMCEYRNRRDSSKSKSSSKSIMPMASAVNPARGDVHRTAISRSQDISVCGSAHPRLLQICLIAIATVCSGCATLLNAQIRQHVRRHSNAVLIGLVAERTLSPDVQPRTNDAAPV